MKIKTVTDFKKYLKDGGEIKLKEVYGEKPKEKVAGIRTVEKMQTNSCKFVGGSWLYFPPASKFEAITLCGRTHINIYEDKEHKVVALTYQLIY